MYVCRCVVLFMYVCAPKKNKKKEINSEKKNTFVGNHYTIKNKYCVFDFVYIWLYFFKCHHQKQFYTFLTYVRSAADLR